MPNKLFKKSIAASIFSLMLLPAQFAHAEVIQVNPDTLIRNIENAQTVDFNLDVDAVATDNGTAKSNSVHFDIDGVADFDRIGAVNFGYSTINQNGTRDEYTGSVVLTSQKIYVSENGGAWYFLEQNSAIAIPTDNDVARGTAMFKSYMSDLFNRGIISYQMESVDFVNNKMAVRYGYSVNYDQLVSYLLEKHAISASQASEIRAQAQGMTINGQFWVDTAEMLPVKLTLNVNGIANNASTGSLQAALTFNSFNLPANISEPQNAVSAEEHFAPAPQPEASSPVTETPVPVAIVNATTVDPSADTDSDGLTDIAEKNVWHSNPTNSDTDGDGYPDYTEVINGYNPNGIGKLDSDNDGLTDYSEMYVYNTDRYNSDCDNDGYNDGLEIANGYNPKGVGRM